MVNISKLYRGIPDVISVAGFSPIRLKSLNVIIGKNGVGKSFLLRSLYKGLDLVDPELESFSFNIPEGSSTSEPRNERKSPEPVASAVAAYFEVGDVADSPYTDELRDFFWILSSELEITRYQSSLQLLSALVQSEPDTTKPSLLKNLQLLPKDMLGDLAFLNEVLFGDVVIESQVELRRARPPFLFSLTDHSNQMTNVAYARISTEKISWIESLLRIKEEYLVGSVAGSIGSDIIHEIKLEVQIEGDDISFPWAKESGVLCADLKAWNGSLLVPLFEISPQRANNCPVFISDQIALEEINIDDLLLKVASVTSRLIGDGFSQPQVDWIHEFGKSFRGILPNLESKADAIFCVHPAIFVASRLLTRYLNENLPSFIMEKFLFKVEINSPDEWIRGSRARIDVFSVAADADEASISLSSLLSAFGVRQNRGHGVTLSTGERRWINALLKMFERDLPSLGYEDIGLSDLTVRLNFEAWKASSSESDLPDEYNDDLFDELFYDDPDFSLAMWDVLINERGAHELIELNYVRLPQLLLIDEPEGNLHPQAIESICGWLIDQNAFGLCVVLATHSLRIFDIQGVDVSRLTLSESQALISLNADVSYLEDIAFEMGFSPGEMFLATKRWLVVEGEVDKVVFESWFGHLFKERGVRVIPARGSGNVDHLMQVDFLGGIGARVSVLLDVDAPDSTQIDPDSLRSRVRQNHFVQALRAGVRRVDSKLEYSEIFFGVEQHEHFDVFMYLEPSIIFEVLQHTRGQIGSSFESWHQVWTDFEDHAPVGKRTVKQFKAFIAEHYGFDFSSDLARKAATLQKQRGKVPASLGEIMRRITAPYYGDRLIK